METGPREVAPPSARREIRAQTHTRRWGRLRTIASVVSLVLGLASTGLGVTRRLQDDPAVARPAPLAVEPDTGVVPSPTEAPGPEVSESLTAPPGSDLDPAWVGCSNPSLGFSLSYPPDWYTGARKAKHACLFFAPSVFDAPRGPDRAETAIAGIRLRVDYDDWVDSYDDPSIEVVERHDVLVGGRSAVAFGFFFTEAPDEIVYQYLIDHDQDLLAFTIQSTFAADPAAARAVLDEMMTTVVFE